MLLLWLPSFGGRVFLFLLALGRPAALPTPLALLSSSPRVERVRFPSESGRSIVADLYFPGGRPAARAGRHPGALLLAPVSRGGLEGEGVKRTGDSLARLGYVVMAAFPEGKTIRYLSPHDIADARAAVERFLQTPRLDPARSIGAGLSYGSGPLFLAVAGLPPSQRPARLLSLGGYADLRELLRFATTGSYAYGGVEGLREPDPYVRELLGRTLVEWAPAGDRELLASLVASPQRELPPGLSPEGRRLIQLLRNPDPDGFDPLYARLPASVQANVAALSLPGRLEGLESAVYILHPREDPFVPSTEARRLWDTLPPAARGDLLLPSALGHGLPPGGIEAPAALAKSLWQVYGFSRRVLYPTPVGL